MEEAQSLKTDRRRRRPALSCVSCRRSKIRCDRNMPCNACVRSKHKTCVYEPQGRHSEISSSAIGPHRPVDPFPAVDSDTAVSPVTSGLNHPRHGEASHEDHSTLSLNGSTSVDSTSSQSYEPYFDVRSLLDRIKELERRLEESPENHPHPKKATQPSTTDPDLVATYPSYLAGELHTMSRSVMTKTRYLGQSHWMNQVGNLKSILEIFDQQYQGKMSEPIAMVNRCKSLARTIKAQRAPVQVVKCGSNIPPREVADKLVDAYLRTWETVFRILHVPSFKRDYENFWLSRDSADVAFVIQLQLVMAIGGAFYDDCYTMRKSAMQWVYEAQSWLISPIPKSRLTLTGLRVMLLLCLAQETASVGQDLVWIHVGQLMRTAIYMGLHKDPKKLPKMSPFRSEVRRRLWNTILEMALQTSVDSGGPPLIYLEQYDTSAPGNYDDDQLADNDDTSASVNPPNKFTDMSVAIALRASFPVRLAIARLLNESSARNTFDDTIQLHNQLSAAYKSLSQQLQRFTLGDRQPTDFQRRLVDLLVRRYFMALHLPYFSPAMTEPAYAFSRKTVVEMSAKLYSTVFPSAASSPRPLRPQIDDLGQISIVPDGDDLARFTTCAAGFARSILSQASMAIGLDLQNQLEEDDGLGPPTPRADLLNILRDATAWTYRRVYIGETNVKGYLVSLALLTHIEGLMKGMKRADLVDSIITAGAGSMQDCFELLKQQAAPQPDEAASTNNEQLDFNSMMAMDQDWEYNSLMQDVLFNFTNIEAVLGVPTGSDMMTTNFS
ncbi:fungal-specific transcription factor domain-containing protein [Daldinia grandis]|nr:fungal-specific transcription factor domain-containing protein [Daldinia grandis]